MGPNEKYLEYFAPVSVCSWSMTQLSSLRPCDATQRKTTLSGAKKIQEFFTVCRPLKPDVWSDQAIQVHHAWCVDCSGTQSHVLFENLPRPSHVPLIRFGEHGYPHDRSTVGSVDFAFFPVIFV